MLDMIMTEEGKQEGLLCENISDEESSVIQSSQ